MGYDLCYGALRQNILTGGADGSGPVTIRPIGDWLGAGAEHDTGQQDQSWQRLAVYGKHAAQILTAQGWGTHGDFLFKKETGPA